MFNVVYETTVVAVSELKSVLTILHCTHTVQHLISPYYDTILEAKERIIYLFFDNST